MLSQRATEPELGEIPIAQNCFLRNMQDLGNLFSVETTEKLQLNDFALARIILALGARLGRGGSGFRLS